MFSQQHTRKLKTTDKIPLFIPLEGVESEHGALIVENGLKQVKGIETHSVEINNRRVVITTGNAEAVSAAVKTIRDLGYGVSTIKRTFSVMQMSCASCAVNVENIIKAQTGVVNANVNFASETVSAEYLPTIIQADGLRKAVQAIGYDLIIADDTTEEVNPEAIHWNKFIELKRKTLLASVLAIAVVIIGMFFMGMPYSREIMWVLSTPVIFWVGRDFFINAWKQARHRTANMDTLVALSTGVAYSYSVFSTLFPQYWHERGLPGHVHFETATVIIAFILLGKLLEQKAKSNTSSAIKMLMGLKPKTVTVVHNGDKHLEIPIEKIRVGDIILVKPGESIAVDGYVTKGESYVDESMLTGEPLPVLKKGEEKVFAGTINQKGSFTFRAEKIGSETMLAQIIRMVKDAQGSKAPVQKLADKVAGIFVPVVIMIAWVSLLAWWWLGGDNGLTHGLMAFVTVLVIACPCALGLATPTAIMVGIGKGAEKGILIKDAESLELAKKVNVIVLDKTGTITEGKPVVTEIKWLEGNDSARQILFSIEKLSEHPLAKAVVKQLKIESSVAVTNFESITGEGVRADVADQTYLVGNKKLLLENNIHIAEELRLQATSWSNESKTVIWFADGKDALAIVGISDKIKETSVEAIRNIRQMGIEVYMLTGDNEATAKAIASQTGITQFKAAVLPQQKADFIKGIQATGKTVAMVGDGINDSAALAQADVSIAMGKGSDIAMEVAKMTIVSSDLNKVLTAIILSKNTVVTIRQNLFWAFIYNILGIPIAAGVLYPFTGFLLDPMIAGAAMALSSVSVVSNSLRLKRKTLQPNSYTARANTLSV